MCSEGSTENYDPPSVQPKRLVKVVDFLPDSSTHDKWILLFSALGGDKTSLLTL